MISGVSAQIKTYSLHYDDDDDDDQECVKCQSPIIVWLITYYLGKILTKFFDINYLTQGAPAHFTGNIIAEMPG
jgi:hypothetical protein